MREFVYAKELRETGDESGERSEDVKREERQDRNGEGLPQGRETKTGWENDNKMIMNLYL